ncbi:MAG: aminodeoxychorismate lyase [Pseudomonadales bacterium]|nr:aminodeoxychorismate lyase [Pseudomonadales bacterium]
MASTGSIVLVNGIESNSIPVNDRGLAYGDGLFETVRVHNGETPLWPYHKDRLTAGCQRLGIQLDLAGIEADLQQLISNKAQSSLLASSDHVIKIMVTRGPGKRGYSPIGANTPTRILSHSDYSVADAQRYQLGVAVRVCSTQLGLNPQLAGIKHLNRLEQVLARSEWNGNEYAEGLMCSAEGHVIDGTMSNFFAVTSGELITSELNGAGVEGVMRRFILKHANDLGFTIRTKNIALDELFEAQQLFVCNSVFGIWPVRLLVDDTGELSRHKEYSDEFSVARAFQTLIESKLYPQ